MSNKTFAIIIVMILVVFALIYIPSSQTSEYKEPISTETTTSSITKKNKSKDNIDFDDEADLKKKISIPDASKAEKRTIKINVGEPIVTTNKKKITINVPDYTKTTMPSKKIIISADDSKQSQTTTLQDAVNIRVIWESIDGSKKGAYTVQTKLDTVLSEELLTENIVKKGYRLKKITEGNEYLNVPATKNEYTVKIKVYN